MEEYEASTYGERIAGVYDDWHDGCEEAMLDLLQELARGGRALELGIGTGRVALPLQARGIDVAGIDVSESMVARLHDKPGGADIPVVHGTFAGFDFDARFDLVYVVFNTFFGLLTQDEQVGCFQSVARHLSDDGVFVLELFVPDVCRFEGGADGARRPRRCRRGAPGRNSARPRSAAGEQPVRRAVRGGDSPLPCQIALCLAIRGRPDGAPGRVAPEASLGVVGKGALLGRQRQAHFCILERIRAIKRPDGSFHSVRQVNRNTSYTLSQKRAGDL
jgi:SAM-dependent methyltransferase